MNLRKTASELCLERATQRMAQSAIVKESTREVMRQSIDGIEQIRVIEAIRDVLIEGTELVWRMEEDGTPVQRVEELTKDRTSQLKTAGEFSFKLLAKVSPDMTLKEITALDGDPLFGQDSKEEIEAELRRLGVDPDALELVAALE